MRGREECSPPIQGGGGPGPGLLRHQADNKKEGKRVSAVQAMGEAEKQSRVV